MAGKSTTRAAMTRPALTPIARRNILIVRLVALVLVAAATAGIWWYQLEVARPREICRQTPGGQWDDRSRSCHVPVSYACEANGGWWEPISKTCAKVVHVPDITGRR
jgi:hypothetical protein